MAATVPALCPFPFGSHTGIHSCTHRERCERLRTCSSCAASTINMSVLTTQAPEQHTSSLAAFTSVPCWISWATVLTPASPLISKDRPTMAKLLCELPTAKSRAVRPCTQHHWLKARNTQVWTCFLSYCICTNSVDISILLCTIAVVEDAAGAAWC